MNADLADAVIFDLDGTLVEEGEARDGDALRAAHGTHFLTTARENKFHVFPGVEALLRELRRRGIATAAPTSSKKEQLLHLEEALRLSVPADR